MRNKNLYSNEGKRIQQNEASSESGGNTYEGRSQSDHHVLKVRRAQSLPRSQADQALVPPSSPNEAAIAGQETV